MSLAVCRAGGHADTAPLQCHLIKQTRIDDAINAIIIVNTAANTVGLVSLEDLVEATLGMEITVEAQAAASLRPAVAPSRKHRAEQPRRQRAQQKPALGDLNAGAD